MSKRTIAEILRARKAARDKRGVRWTCKLCGCVFYKVGEAPPKGCPKCGPEPKQ